MAEIKDFNRNQYLLKGGKDNNNNDKGNDSEKNQWTACSQGTDRSSCIPF